jgi:hypothetical protein
MVLALAFPSRKPIDLKNLHVYDVPLKKHIITVLHRQSGLSGR